MAEQTTDQQPVIQAPSIEIPDPVSTIVEPVRNDKVAFSDLYNQLNTEQKEAVDTIEGPVMVIAGPGSGKTQILTLRIANILRTTQMNPRNILALTFTDSAAANMRKRLVSVIGPAAYGVGIYTFHGFANSIIAEFPYKFQFARELEQIDEIEQIEIIEKLIDSLELQDLRPPRAPYHYTSEIIGRIGDLKNENISPQDLTKITTGEIDRLQNDPESIHEKGAHKGKMKAAVVDEIKQLEKCRELAMIYAAYQQKLLEKGLYDYADMILFVVKQLEEDAELKAYYQERFQYILVDEYQDTNSAQNRLVELVADFFESPNLFVVGDDKQSIFRFQGASMANMLAFYRKYPEMRVISLQRNYRSNQTILDVSHKVIEQATERITRHIDGISDELIASNPRFTPSSLTGSDSALDRGSVVLQSDSIPDQDTTPPVRNDNVVTPVSLTVFSSQETEQYWIAQKIKQLIEQGSVPEEIAIIYKENREADAFADLLGRLNIAFSLERGSNVLVDTDIRRILTMLRAIADPLDSRAVFEFLHYDFTDIDKLDLLRLTAYRAVNRATLIETLDAISQGAAEIKLDNTEAVTSRYQQLAAWRVASANSSMPEFIEAVIRESGLLNQILESSTKIDRLHRLRRFFDEVKKLATKDPLLTLEKLLDYFDLLISNHIQLVPPPLDTGAGEGTIRLMTAHKAKGLEFEHVFLPNLIDKHWGNASRRSSLKLPANLISHINTNKDEKNEDDRRLFYVALTRAKQCLYLSYAKRKNGKELLPSQFLAEIGEEGITRIDTETSEIQAGAHLLTLFSPIEEVQFNEQEAEYLRQLIREQPITPTGLNNYLHCPKGYLYKNLLRIPTAKSASQGYGTAIHAAMQAFFIQHKATKHVPELDYLLQAFRDALTKEILSPVDFEAFLRKGTAVLTHYFEQHLRSVTPTVAVEYAFDPHHIIISSEAGDIYVTGKLDKLELLDGPTNSVRIIDYKTGRARSRNEIEGKTATADEDYKRQLIFYQMLSELDKQFPYKVKETGLAFVDDDERFTTEIFEVTKEEVKDLEELIKTVYAQMLNLEFPHIEDPNRPACEFCDI